MESICAEPKSVTNKENHIRPFALKATTTTLSSQLQESEQRG